MRRRTARQRPTDPGGWKLSEREHGDGEDQSRREPQTPESSGPPAADGAQSGPAEETASPSGAPDDAAKDDAATNDAVTADADPEPAAGSAAGGDESAADAPADSGAFQDSGTFFRERVARTLAEQGYGFSDDGRVVERPDDPGPAEQPAGGSDDPAEDAAADTSADEQRAADPGPPKADEPASAPAGEPAAGAGSEAAAAEGSALSAAPASASAEESAESPEGAEPAAEDPGDDTPDTPDTADTPDTPGTGSAPSSALAAPPAGAAGGAAPPAPGSAFFSPPPGRGTPPRAEEPAAADAPDPDTSIARPYVQAEPESEGHAARADGPDTTAWKMDFAAAEAAKSDRPGEPAADPAAEPESDAAQHGAAPYGDGPATAPPGAATGAAAGAAGAAAAAQSGAPEGPAPAEPSEPSSAHSGGGPGGPSGPDDPKGGAAAAAGGTPKKGGRPPRGPKSAKPKKPPKPLWWRITRGGLIAAAVMFLLGAGVFGVAYATIPVPPNAQSQATDQGSTFYYDDGKTVFAERGVNRDPVKLDRVPKEVQNAILSAENRGFWDEPGVSITGTLRGVWSTVTGKQVQGGSTITQQMVRNYYEGLSQEQTVTRKFKEIIISLKVDRSQSKEWILEQYLNTIYFGRNAYGIQAASQAYFHKDVGELSPDEASFLAAAIQQPTKFGIADAKTTPEMEQRWNYVVKGLVTMESITPAKAEAYEFPIPKKEIPQSGVDLSGYRGYMFQQTMSELERLGFSEDNVNRGGLEVTTTFNKKLMDAAKESVENNVPVDDLPDGVNAGLTAVDPTTGEVVAFYGGKDYLDNQYDSAFRGSAQAGSAFKPYVLGAALKNDFSLNTVVDGNGPQSFAGSSVQNAGNDPGGNYNLIQATAKSNNVGYVHLGEKVGLDKVVEFAHDAGIPKSKITKDQAGAATLPLGVSDVSPVDQAGGYSTFANGGEHIETHVVRSVKDKQGEEQRPEVKRKRVLTEDQAADVSYALQQVVQSGTGTSAQIGRPAAGKTGTTSGSVAAWFVGYTPQLTSSVGIYNGDNQPFSVPGYGTLSGGTLPTQVWREFMSKAMEGKEVKQFPPPSYGGNTQNFAPPPPPETEQPEETREPEQPEEPEEPSVPEEPEEPPPPPTDPPETVPPPEVPPEPGPGDPGIPEG
ncbi:membrane peptidoglycan carboxypeptidase [Murinocardiopsis flavida]|uniref:Membrane peptidoglycan carboxypeptidase n=1 Tax=Murinocardiopsis flavida TaxID=645275 RepID=A0A2P8DJQ1_9ACTN|nr:transglycosylase domain-containing protein [Murinocardiopsis flavida]PSK97453.1 membrane peptidoglycan carboxypeptidase [Murinocardiopsis flavida]